MPDGDEEVALQSIDGLTLRNRTDSEMVEAFPVPALRDGGDSVDMNPVGEPTAEHSVDDLNESSNCDLTPRPLSFQGIESPAIDRSAMHVRRSSMPNVTYAILPTRDAESSTKETGVPRQSKNERPFTDGAATVVIVPSSLVAAISPPGNDDITPTDPTAS